MTPVKMQPKSLLGQLVFDAAWLLVRLPSDIFPFSLRERVLLPEVAKGVAKVNCNIEDVVVGCL